MDSFLYFLWISITVSLALVWTLKRAERTKFPIQLILQLTGWLLIVIPLGARILHIIYEEPAYYFENPIRMFEVWRGGFVYYGGLIAGVLFSVMFFLKNQRERSFFETADFLTPSLCFGTGLGRIACFLQSCCYGREWDSVLAIKGRHPTQLYIFFWELLLLIFILRWERKFLNRPGLLFLFWIGLSALGRFVIEFYRDDFRGHFYFGLSISQLISLVLVIACTSLAIRLNSRVNT